VCAGHVCGGYFRFCFGKDEAGGGGGGAGGGGGGHTLRDVHTKFC
jgi:hypothetical protein